MNPPDILDLIGSFFLVMLALGALAFVMNLGDFAKDLFEALWKLTFLRYYIWRESRWWRNYEQAWLEKRRDILPDKIIKKKEWLIPEGKGHEWVLLQEVLQAIRAEKIPRVRYWADWVMYEEVRSVVVAVAHERLIGARLNFGSRDYGDKLKAYYFITWDSVPLELERTRQRRAKQDPDYKPPDFIVEDYKADHRVAKALMTRRDKAYGVCSPDNFTEGDKSELETVFKVACAAIDKAVEKFEYDLGRQSILAGATQGFIDIL